MKKILDPLPILVAGALAAVVVLLGVGWFDTSNPNRTNAMFYGTLGFVTGMLVQVGVRLFGVS